MYRDKRLFRLNNDVGPAIQLTTDNTNKLQEQIVALGNHDYIMWVLSVHCGCHRDTSGRH